MRAITTVLLGMMWLSPPLTAADDEASAVADIPFDFVPKEFQGKWVLTRFQHLANAPAPPGDPDYFIGRHVEIGNNWVNLFGHVCETSYLMSTHTKGNPRFNDFDKFQIPDADIEEQYPSSRYLIITCTSPFEPPTQGPEAALLNFYGGSQDIIFQLYDPSRNFLTLSVTEGQTLILRPVGWPDSLAPQGEQAD